jgi:hypothetical protein
MNWFWEKVTYVADLGTGLDPDCNGVNGFWPLGQNFMFSKSWMVSLHGYRLSCSQEVLLERHKKYIIFVIFYLKKYIFLTASYPFWGIRNVGLYSQHLKKHAWALYPFILRFTGFVSTKDYVLFRWTVTGFTCPTHMWRFRRFLKSSVSGERMKRDIVTFFLLFILFIFCSLPGILHLLLL